MNPSPRRLRSTVLLGIATCTVLALTAVPAAHAQSSTLPGSSAGLAPRPATSTETTDPSPHEYLDQLVAATNTARAANGLAPLRVNGDLMRLAGDWSAVQARQNRLEHNPDLRSQLPAGWHSFGENVLQNYRGATPDQLVDQWMASPGHRANILRSGYTDIGVGVAFGAEDTLYATQVFTGF